jgi:hypothetical protein
MRPSGCPGAVGQRRAAHSRPAVGVGAGRSNFRPGNARRCLAASAQRRGGAKPDPTESDEPRELVVGIDLGTTNSAVAFIVDGRPKCAPNADGDLITPSVVSVLPDGELTPSFPRSGAAHNGGGGAPRTRAALPAGGIPARWSARRGPTPQARCWWAARRSAGPCRCRPPPTRASSGSLGGALRTRRCRRRRRGYPTRCAPPAPRRKAVWKTGGSTRTLCTAVSACGAVPLSRPAVAQAWRPAPRPWPLLPSRTRALRSPPPPLPHAPLLP